MASVTYGKINYSKRKNGKSRVANETEPFFCKIFLTVNSRVPKFCNIAYNAMIDVMPQTWIVFKSIALRQHDHKAPSN